MRHRLEEPYSYSLTYDHSLIFSCDLLGFFLTRYFCRLSSLLKSTISFILEMAVSKKQSFQSLWNCEGKSCISLQKEK